MKNLVRASQFFKPELSGIVLAATILIASLVIGLVKPWPLALIVDNVLGTEPFPSILQPYFKDHSSSGAVLIISSALLVLFVVQAGFSSLANYLSIGVGLRGLQRVRNAVFDALQRLSLRFHCDNRTGDLIHRAATDSYAFQTLFQQGLMVGLGSTLSLLLILIVMLQLNIPLTLLSLAVVPLLIGSIRFFGRQMHQRGLKAQQGESNVTSFLQQSIFALPLTVSYTREDSQSETFGNHTKTAARRRQSQHGSEIVYGLMIALTLALGTAAITYVGSKEVVAGNLTIGELLVFLAYLTQMFDPLNQLSYVGSTMANALAGVDRVFEILDSPDIIQEKPTAKSISPTNTGSPNSIGIRGKITLRDVHFAYRPEHNILKGINLDVEAGQSVALIGPSGAGKTTLINLLPRFYDPTQGCVLLDDCDLRDLKLKELRAHIGLLLQEPILLPGTLAENIAYGKQDATQEEIEQASREAQAHEFISAMPDQYQTVVGDGALRLSVGEKQRINLARAFLKNAPILILDEPTSALDAESEKAIADSIRRLMKGRTTIVVAHRLATIAKADKLFVLEDGRVSQSGTPSELLNQPGYYKQIIESN